MCTRNTSSGNTITLHTKAIKWDISSDTKTSAS